MNNLEPEKAPIKQLGTARRKAISMSQEELIRVEGIHPQQTLPLLIQPSIEGLDLISWALSNREFIETHVLRHGGILFRNFRINGVTQFEQFVKVVSKDLLEYDERSSPRSHVSGNVYTSTDYPANQEIFLHNENSYQHNWPMKIFFFCVTPALKGGETPIADVRKVFERINPKIREQFIQRKVMYIRNFGDGFGLPWQTVFRTTDRAAVEEYCRKSDIAVEWKDSNRLRTRAVRQAVARHPRTGEMVWFNHATFFHVSTLQPMMREALLADFQEEDLPTHTVYGDGSPIEPFVLDEFRKAYRQEMVFFTWQEGDILLLDNMLVAHGRAPFVGPREILVGMAEPFSGRSI